MSFTDLVFLLFVPIRAPEGREDRGAQLGNLEQRFVYEVKHPD